MLKIVFSLLLFFVSLHADSIASKEQIHFLFFGAFAMMILYNFAYSLITKTATFMSYALFHLSLFIIMLFFTELVGTSFTHLQVERVPVGFLFLAVVMLLAFSRDFLEIKRVSPLIIPYINSLIIINMLPIFLSAFISISSTIKEFSILFLVLEILTVMFFTAYLAFKKKHLYGVFYFLSFFPLFTILVLSLVSYVSHIELSEHMEYWFEVAILVEASGLSLVLIYQHKETTLLLRQNELLFKELSHRVQNNLQQVISIITLQIGSSQDERTKEYLEETISRISAIALIHKTLQHSSKLGVVNMNSFFNMLTKAYSKLDTSVTFKISTTQEMELDVERLAPLALILNELITNSLKHAFRGEEDAQIFIGLKEDDDLLFTYEDNGKGIDEESTQDSIGSKLITILAKNQLKGEVSTDTDGRYFFSLKFKNNTGASL